jgi:AraC family transcriptional regulator, regulatory protein of adaptative response / methylphosphotriester-DNA alkyltransferase methyltransferase
LNLPAGNKVRERVKNNLMPTQTLPIISLRQKEIVKDYLLQLDKHIDELRHGVAEKTFEIKDLADLLHIHPTHLSNTISQVLGQSPCDIYEQKLVAISKELLLASNRPIAEIARQLSYDPSNFTKFFKHFEGITPKQFRESQIKI